jgi:CheY-like chemotaxis protein
VLCVDDEAGILSALRRLLRREGYRLLTANTCREALEILERERVQLIISDQRMPEMSGTELLAEVKKRFPEIVRIILSGYTEVDTITEAINRGHIYKFFLKPWNDQSLKLEIRQALDQYDLLQANRRMQQTILEQNEELRRANENLESLVAERTRTLTLQNEVLELSHAILDDLPLPLIGVSSEGMVVMANARLRSFFGATPFARLGSHCSASLPPEAVAGIALVMASHRPVELPQVTCAGRRCRMALIPLSGRFRERGLMITFQGEHP